MNQNNSKHSVPKWIIYTLFGVVIILLISTILRLITPKNKIQPTALPITNYDQTQSEFSNLEYSGPNIALPTELPIASAKITDYSDQLIKEIITQFSLTQIDDFQVWVSDEWGLSLDQDNNRFVLSTQKISPVVNKNITFQTATEVAQKFLEKNLDNYKVELLTSQTEYFDGLEGESITNHNGRAPIIKISFGNTLNDYPVFYQNNIESFISIYVDANQQIRKADFKTQGVELEKINKKSLVSPQNALLLANSTNQAAIINTGYKTPVKLDFSQITKGTFSFVELEYRVDPEQNLAYPFYRFRGIITDQNKQSFEAELITPAVEITPSY